MNISRAVEISFPTALVKLFRNHMIDYPIVTESFFAL